MEPVNIPMANTAMNDFIGLAIQNTNESWSKIHAHLPWYCNNEVFVFWAKINLLHDNYALRHLAATILVISETALSQQDIDGLIRLMNEDYKENAYPSFRAALALAKRLSDVRISSLNKKIREKVASFLEDNTVWSLARETLEAMY